MNLQEGLIAAFSVLTSVFIVIVVVCFGWYLVWKLFLSRFKLVRELLGLAQSSDSPAHSLDSSSVDGSRLRNTRKPRKD
ncbi:small integral membrane protein 13 [Topomyia yanbarensis]|uniref:small integral membrane protein 13 n=1 Tax=Topomyia yanbarensis TaxID=2498891 RepID=UPI00273C1F63|nr:small integral membrane protein 13 [Topomyia yanbarensis]